MKWVDHPGHHVMLGMNNCKTLWRGTPPGQHCKWLETGVDP